MDFISQERFITNNFTWNKCILNKKACRQCYLLFSYFWCDSYFSFSFSNFVILLPLLLLTLSLHTPKVSTILFLFSRIDRNAINLTIYHICKLSGLRSINRLVSFVVRDFFLRA